MSITVTPNQAFSYPVVGYGYDITGCVQDGTTANSITLTGVDPEFVPAGLIIVDVATTSASSATAEATYASVDTASIVNNANSAQTVVFSLYVKSVSGAHTNAIVRVFLY